MKMIQFIIFMVAFVVGGLLGSITSAHAEIVSLGKTGGDLFVYDSDTVTTVDNTVSVWVLTNSKKYNVAHQKHYALFGVHMLLQCTDNTYAVYELATFDKNGAVIGDRKIADVHFSEAEMNTIPRMLLRRVCQPTG